MDKDKTSLSSLLFLTTRLVNEENHNNYNELIDDTPEFNSWGIDLAQIRYPHLFV